MSDTDTRSEEHRDPVKEQAEKKADVATAKGFAPSGAANQVTDFDQSHLALDANPRAGTSELQNRIDFNDPTKSSAEAVADSLKAQEKD